ncbi:MAG: hypothetical protein OD811_01210 [Alphaproteobacteria bacterium]
MSISRFFQVSIVGLSLTVLAACGSTAADIEADAGRILRAAEPTDLPIVELGTDTSALQDFTNKGVAFVDEVPPVGVDVEAYKIGYQGFGFSRLVDAAGAPTGVGLEGAAVDPGTGNADDGQVFTKLVGGRLLATDAEKTVGRFGDYIPFYLGWAASVAGDPVTVDGEPVPQYFVAPGLGIQGERYGRTDEDAPDAGGGYDSPFDYAKTHLGRSTGLNFETDATKPNVAPDPKFGDVYSLNSYNLIARTVTGTSTIGWAGLLGTETTPAQQNPRVLNYHVEIIHPQVYGGTAWTLQYSTFILTRSKLSATNGGRLLAAGQGSSNYLDAHIFSRIQTQSLKFREGQSSGTASYNSRLAAWGLAPDSALADGGVDRAGKLYLLLGRGTLVASFSGNGVSSFGGKFKTELHEVLKDPGPAIRTDISSPKKWRDLTLILDPNSNGFNIQGDVKVDPGASGQEFETATFDGDYDPDGGTGFRGNFAGPKAEEVVGLIGFTSDDAGVPDFLGAFAGERYED